MLRFPLPILRSQLFACATLSRAGRRLSYTVANISTGETTRGFCKCHSMPSSHFAAAKARKVSATVKAGSSFALLYPASSRSQWFCLRDVARRRKALILFCCEYLDGGDNQGFLQVPRQALLGCHRGAGQEGFCDRHGGLFVGFALPASSL